MNSEVPNDSQYGVEDLCKEVANVVSDLIRSIHNIWIVTYGTEDSLNLARVNDLKEYISNFFCELENEAQDQKNELIKKSEDSLREILQLEKLLEVQEKLNLNNYTETDIPLTRLNCHLQSVLSKHRAEKDERMEKLHMLQKKQEAICNFLNMTSPPPCLMSGSIPTLTELQKMEEEICELEQQKRATLDEFYECRKAVASLIKELNTLPVLKPEVAACKQDDDLFPPNKIHLEELKILKEKLIEKLNNDKREAAELREKLKGYWGRLKWNPSDLDGILTRHRGHSHVDISELKKELARCEEETLTHMEELIVGLREEISYYWDKLYFPEDEKKKFQWFYTTDYDEGLLLIHETQIKSLKIIYEKYKHICKLVDERKEYWDRLKTLEEAAKDPDRLFKNRGAHLLQEEKERKTIQKVLPKIEESLLEYISEYEERTGIGFSIHGQSMGDLIKTEWENWEASKAADKKARKNANSHEAEPRQRTPNIAGVKRKPAATPKQHNVSNKIIKLCRTKATKTIFKNFWVLLNYYTIEEDYLRSG